MKRIQSILFFLVLLFFLSLAFSVQAGPNTLERKIQGIWYNNEYTVLLNFDKNLFVLFFRTDVYSNKITQTEQVENVLFLTTANGKKKSMSLLSDDIAVWKSKNPDQQIAFIRWKGDNISKKVFNGEWTTNEGTITYDFDNNQCISISGKNKKITHMKDIDGIANILYYYEIETGKKCGLRYITDRQVIRYTDSYPQYEILMREVEFEYN